MGPDGILIKVAVNLSPASYDPAFGSGTDASVKAKVINLIASIRTIMRSAATHCDQTQRRMLTSCSAFDIRELSYHYL